MNSYHIFIDGSYYTFYRLFALINWWKLSHKDENYLNLHENKEFVDKFRKMFIEKLKEIPKKLKINKQSKDIKFYIGKDCPRNEIWRNSLYDKYKAGRSDYKDADNQPHEFFKIVYNENLFIKAIPNCNMLSFNQLEADDCIAITIQELINSKPYDEFIIITSDLDYLQLMQQRLQIFDLKFKDLTLKKQFVCSKKELLYKIIIGDKSDNIESIIPRCGKKKALQYCNNMELFNNLLEDNIVYDKYLLNRNLIDFNKIPMNLRNDFINKYNTIL